MKLSLVIAVYNEEENILPLADKVRESLDGYDFEAIFIDDGSSDRTKERILSISDPRFVLIEFKKNYGQSSATSAGFHYASGDYIITLDGDLQNDPSSIPAMVEEALKGDWDLVAGVRKNRKDDFFIRKLPSRIANKIIRQSTGVKIQDNGCALKVFKADLAKNINLYGELHRFINLLAAMEGATIQQVEVDHYPRIHGRSKYNLSRTTKVMSDLMLLVFFKRYMQKPMHFFGKWGMIIFSAGMAINIYLLIEKLMGHDIWGRPILILGILLVLAGFQILTIGIVAEVVMRTYFESQNKRPYRIKKVYAGGKEV